MGILGKDICGRCFTTHPLNDAGERACSKPPIEVNDDFIAPAVIWKTNGATRGYNGGGRIPRTDQLVKNPGHEPPTVGKMALTPDQVKQLGI
jgi:hypothetical protein